MHPTNNSARVAGALYLLNGVTGFLEHHLCPPHPDRAWERGRDRQHILASEMHFRVGIVIELICAAEFIFLVRAPYRLLNGVDKMHASLMATLALVSVPIMFLNVLNEIAALALLRGADFLSVFEKQRLDALAMLFLVCITMDLLSTRSFLVSGSSPSASW